MSKKFIWILIGLFIIISSGKIFLFFKMKRIYYLIIRYITVILSIIAIIIIALLFEKIKIKYIENILETTGKYTLELYIFHIAYRELFNYFNYSTSVFKYEIVMVILTVISSIAFNKIYGYIINQFKGVDINEQNLRRRH